MPFRNRHDAGRKLAAVLASRATHHPIVLAIPRGGLPIGYEVARALSAPLDVIVARRLVAGLQHDLDLGAVADGGIAYVDEDICNQLGLSSVEMQRIARHAVVDVEALSRLLASYRPRLSLAGASVIVTDDGIASGGTARAAIRSARKKGARNIVLAVPVAAAPAAEMLEREVDELVCLERPDSFTRLSDWYRDFAKLTDDDVIALLDRAQHHEFRCAAADTAEGAESRSPERPR